MLQITVIDDATFRAANFNIYLSLSIKKEHTTNHNDRQMMLFSGLSTLKIIIYH